jgi:3-oxoacyl-[acyl-carrier-protein] synthase-3
MMETCENLLKRNDVKVSDLKRFIPHQANKRIIRGLRRTAGLTDEQVVINIDRYGNTTAATIPLAMDTARTSDRLKKGDLVLIASVGAGFTVGASLLKWEA